MAAYIGNAEMIDLQKTLQHRQDLFKQTPSLANGGRIMNILDPDAFGWDNVHDYALRDGFVALNLVDKEPTLVRLTSLFDGNAAFPFWLAFTGTPDPVVPACQRVVDGFKIPKGWRIAHHTHPYDTVIETVQQLSMDAGVAPYPAYYMQGHEARSLLSCIYDEQGDMVACASANMRYHPQSSLADWLFAGGVSVAETQRGRGLGTFVNAAMLRESQTAFGWVGVLELVKADNAASLAMIKRCGLMQDSRVTIVVATGGGHFTR